MSKIVYLLGAGASYGTRYKDNKGQDLSGIIERGIPIVSEFAKAIDRVITGIHNGDYDNKLTNSKKESDEQIVIEELLWLKECCDNYPTIDTYAKLLFVTQEFPIYYRLKKILSVFLLLAQNINKRDLRYDGFIASLINDKGLLPDICLLSWNYDAQFEFAYSGYMPTKIRDMQNIWSRLGTLHKNVVLSNKNISNFSMIKLNGTAFNFMFDNNKNILDLFFNNKGQSLINLAHMMLDSSDEQIGLSFAWEKEDEEENEENDTFIEQVKTKTNDAEVLVVIGYSFPYVNREIDKKILDGMHNLKKIYVQDPNADEIKESLLARLYPKKETDYEWKLSKNTRQFIIPNELI